MAAAKKVPARAAATSPITPPARAKITIHPVTPERWADMARLFGPRGACAGCWCLFWKQSAAEWQAGKGEGNRRVQQKFVRTGGVPGLLAYAGDTPVGWCAVEPRSVYHRLDRSRVLKPVDDRPVWSVVCFFVAREYRRRGVTVALLRAAADHARQHGAKILEGYPNDPRQADAPDVFMYTGIQSAFEKAGFREVARRSPARPIMRRELAAPRRRG